MKDFTRMQKTAWAKAVIAATEATIKQGGEIPPSVVPFVQEALDYMEEQERSKCKCGGCKCNLKISLK